MSAPVNVLAVLDEARRDLQIAAEYKGMLAAGEVAADLIEARAAVAELIEAADEASVALGKSMQHTHELCSHMRLCAALARVQGGAA